MELTKSREINWNMLKDREKWKNQSEQLKAKIGRKPIKKNLYPIFLMFKTRNLLSVDKLIRRF